MEIYNYRSLAELGLMDHGFTNHWSVSGSVDELSTVLSSMAAATTYGQDTTTLHNMHSSNSHHHQPLLSQKHSMEMSPTDANRQIKQQKSSSWSSSNTDNHHLSGANFHVVNSSSCYTPDNQAVSMVKPKEEKITSPVTLSFSPDHMMAASNASYDHQNQNYVFKAASQGAKRVSANARLTQAQDHIIAERKRREKLSQRFIALSALLPGLKKMDKASVLGDAIKHLKQLQEKVATLEEEVRKNSMERVVYVKKCTLGADDDHENSYSDYQDDSSVPEVEAKFCNKEVLVRVHCEKRKGIHEKTIAEIEKLRLSVINHGAMTFGGSILDITVTAQMEEGFAMPIKDLVKHLRSALKKFM